MTPSPKQLVLNTENGTDWIVLFKSHCRYYIANEDVRESFLQWGDENGF